MRTSFKSSFKKSFKKMRDSLAAGAERARGVVWAAALVILAVVLTTQAWRSRDDNYDLRRRAAALDRELDRLHNANTSLEKELKALQSDPVYVEALLRSRKMALVGERQVEQER